MSVLSAAETVAGGATSILGGWKIKAILAVVALVGIGTPGFLGYRYVKHVIEDNKTLTTDRDAWKQRATYWYQQDQATLQRLKDAQATMGLLAQNHTKATTTQRSVSDAFKQSPTSTAADADRAVNDAFGVLACATGGTCGARPAAPSHRPARP